MAGRYTNPHGKAPRRRRASFWSELWADFYAMGKGVRPQVILLRLRQFFQRRLVRRLAIIAGSVVGVLLIATSLLWWRLNSGPIDLDLATPWLTSAIEENFGSQHKVFVGGTQLERDESGRASLRIRDIVVRDREGNVVASAPKAEVSINGASLFSGRVRAERLSLVGAELAVRIEGDGNVTVFAANEKRSSVTAGATKGDAASTGLVSTKPTRAIASAPATSRGGALNFTSLLAWIDGLRATGLDGHDLAELGLKSGTLVVDDQRNGKRWAFENINLSLTRSKNGAVEFKVTSENPKRPWNLKASVQPSGRGHRVVLIEADSVSTKDILLAMRLGGSLDVDIPVSARIRADIGPDGRPRIVDGKILAEKGSVHDLSKDKRLFDIDRGEFSLDWDAARGTLVVPFQVIAGGNRFTLLAQLAPPRENSSPWNFSLTGGTVVLASAGGKSADPLVLNRLELQLRSDPAKKRIVIDRGEIGNSEVGIALSGSVDYGGTDPRVALGIAGNRMSADTMVRLWPAMLAIPAREWVAKHIDKGVVEKVIIATNAHLANVLPGGPPMGAEEFSLEMVATDVTLRPLNSLPAIRNANVVVHTVGRGTTVSVARGDVVLPAGRKLQLSNGTFRVADGYLPTPPAKVAFRVDGPVAALAELLAMDRLREFAASPLDPDTSRGTMTAQVALAFPLDPKLPPGSTDYDVKMDVSNFAAERMVANQKLEASALRVTGNREGFRIKGDVKINGIPAALDYFRGRGQTETDIRLQATIDDAVRKRLGVDVGSTVSGPIPVKVSGRLTGNDGQGRFDVEADLKAVKIDNLLPGWVKPAGRKAKATFVVVRKPDAILIESFLVDGAGSQLKGEIALEKDGDLVSANFPVFSLSNNDKANLKVDRAPDGTLHVVMRGDIFDGRGFIKSSLAGPGIVKSKSKSGGDVDLDIKLGTVVGFHGETLRSIDLKMSRRKGTVNKFELSARLGRDATLIGDMRKRPDGRPVVYFETNDAGSLFRFIEMYVRLHGGHMWVAMDPPSDDTKQQFGTVNIRDFSVRGEAALDRVVGRAANSPSSSVDFSRVRVEFTRTPGRFTIREGAVSGPIIGATIDGRIDYARNEVHMRGTFVPLYGLNNMFGQIPIVGLILGGGQKEGLVGITYEVVGPPGAPILRVNPISAIAPGLLRKIFEFPNINDPRVSEPVR